MVLQHRHVCTILFIFTLPYYRVSTVHKMQLQVPVAAVDGFLPSGSALVIKSNPLYSAGRQGHLEVNKYIPIEKEVVHSLVSTSMIPLVTVAIDPSS